MPCYLFTWHTYGSWLPDRPEGYVHWNRGLQSSSIGLAQCYRKQQKQSVAKLTDQLQEQLLFELLESAEAVDFRLHFAATDPTHIHVLVSWSDNRQAKQIGRSLRRSLTMRLNRFSRRKWFSRGGHVKRVKSRSHFHHLVSDYLPNHRDWKWVEGRGRFK